MFRSRLTSASMTYLLRLLSEESSSFVKYCQWKRNAISISSVGLIGTRNGEGFVALALIVILWNYFGAEPVKTELEVDPVRVASRLCNFVCNTIRAHEKGPFTACHSLQGSRYRSNCGNTSYQNRVIIVPKRNDVAQSVGDWAEVETIPKPVETYDLAGIQPPIRDLLGEDQICHFVDAWE